MQRIVLGPTRRTLLASPGLSATLRGCPHSNIYRITIHSEIAPPMPNVTLPRRVSSLRPRFCRGRVDDHSPLRAACSHVLRVSIERRSPKEEENVPRPPGRVAVCGELTRICR